MARDGAAQQLVARADRVAAQRGAVALRGAADRAAHPVLREQLAARAGGAEGDVARIGGQAHHLLAQRADIDRARVGRRQRGLGLGQARRARGHEVARARAGLDQPGVLQRAVGLDDGRQRHALLARQLAHRRNALAARQRAGADRLRDALGDLQVERVVGGRGRGARRGQRRGEEGRLRRHEKSRSSPILSGPALRRPVQIRRILTGTVEAGTVVVAAVLVGACRCAVRVRSPKVQSWTATSHPFRPAGCCPAAM